MFEEHKRALVGYYGALFYQAQGPLTRIRSANDTYHSVPGLVYKSIVGLAEVLNLAAVRYVAICT